MAGVRQKRLVSEFNVLKKDPLDNIDVTIANDNMDTWYVKIHKLSDDGFVGGEYLLEILMPKDYPFSPPDFRMLTPNGRFDINRKLCFSNSGYHPEDWSPMWNMKTIIMGFLSFFLEKKSSGIGHLDTTVEQKEAYAKQSVETNKHIMKERGINFG
jgi:ubiquitin-protein ligase